MKITARTSKVLAVVSALVVAGLLATRGPLRLHGQAEPAAAKPALRRGEARLIVEAGIANARCPITRTELDADRTPERLTRRLGGMKIGFCCAACIVTWDRLNEQEMQSRVEAAAAPPIAPR